MEVTTVDDLFRLRTGTTAAQPLWAIMCGLAGVVLVLASFVYGAIRAVWRLHKGDVEEAGNDGRTLGR